jgi:DNA primase
VFPVTHNGKLYGWQERSIRGDIKMTMKGFERDKALMFYDNLNDSKHAIVTEGPVDALKCDILGGSVCTMGKDIGDYQIKLIVTKVDKVYLALDPDASAEKARLCKAIADFKEVFIMTPPKKDFGMCSEEEVIKSFEEAVPYFGQTFIHLIDLYDRS